MFRELARLFTRYDSAVLSYADACGYPISLRVAPSVVAAEAIVELGLTSKLGVDGAAASLLVHDHDEALSQQTSTLVRGRVVPSGNTHVFVPTVIVPGIEQGPRAFLRFVLDGRRATARYLATRGLPRPEVPWSDIHRLVERARGPR
jgi:hypothetical protein